MRLAWQRNQPGVLEPGWLRDEHCTFTSSPTGGQGGGQETINMRSWASGDAKLVNTFGNGNCSPTVTPRDAYTLSAEYTSSVPVFFTLYSRDAATGAWGYWTQSPTFPATDKPTLATRTAPAVPSTVNGASFGMTIDSVGTVTTSQYSRVDNGPLTPLTPLTLQTIAFTGPGTGTVGANQAPAPAQIRRETPCMPPRRRSNSPSPSIRRPSRRTSASPH